jgi:hypothetical protein
MLFKFVLLIDIFILLVLITALIFKCRGKDDHMP